MKVGPDRNVSDCGSVLRDAQRSPRRMNRMPLADSPWRPSLVSHQSEARAKLDAKHDLHERASPSDGTILNVRLTALLVLVGCADVPPPRLATPPIEADEPVVAPVRIPVHADSAPATTDHADSRERSRWRREIRGEWTTRGFSPASSSWRRWAGSASSLARWSRMTRSPMTSRRTRG